MKDSLNIIIELKKTIIYLDKVIVNFPGNERKLKDKIRGTLYDLLEILYMSNEYKIEREAYQTRAVVKIKMVDFYLKISCDKKYISYKKYQKVSLHLLDILRQIYGWIRYEKKEKIV